MIESFVDLTYRGLPVGRRIKLTQVRPTTGYLELPTPMPVGTRLAISTEDGVALEATVIHLHEQVAGVERPPGMTVSPVLADDGTAAWWQARVGLPELDPAPEPPRATPAVRAQTPAMPPPAVAVERAPEEPPPIEIERAPEAQPARADASPAEWGSGYRMPPVPDEPAPVAQPRPEQAAPAGDDKRTTVMNAIDQELLEELSGSSGELERMTRTDDEMPVVDDGKKTIVMNSIDVSALGFEVTASGSFRAFDDELDGDDDTDDSGAPPAAGSPPADKPRPAGPGKKRKKKR